MWPIILVGLGITAVVAASRKTEGKMTPARRIVFQTALAKDPPLSGAQFYALAKEFDAEGLTAEADILRKRGRVRSLPQSELDKIATAYQAGLSSKDPVQVRALANAMETEGLFSSARQLRDYANGLDVAHVVAGQAEAAQATADMHSTLNNAPASTLASAYSQAAPAGSQAAAQSQANAPASPLEHAVAAAASVLPGPLAGIVGGHAGDIANAAQGALGSALGSSVPSASDVESQASQALGNLF